jgi:nucleoid-associated protein YgaU
MQGFTELAALGAPAVPFVGFIIFALLAVVGKVPTRVPIELFPWQRVCCAALAVFCVVVAIWLALRVPVTPSEAPTEEPGTPSSHVTPIRAPEVSRVAPSSPTREPSVVPSPEVSATPGPEATPDVEMAGPQEPPEPSPYPQPEACASSFPRAPDEDTVWRYVVKNGETLEDLSAMFGPYSGDGELDWRDICEANQSVIGQDCGSTERLPQIHSGQLLTIPGVTVPIKYEVGSSDSLVTIAAKFYGKFQDNSEPLWHRIYCDNYGVIGDNPSLLNRGQQLSIYPLKRIEFPEYAVRPGDSLSVLARAFYNDETVKDSLCDSLREQGHDDCSHVVPHQILELSPVPEGVPYTVQLEDELEWIAAYCYGRPDKASQIHSANRTVLGDDPSYLHPGQQIMLYGCTVARGED